VTHFRILHPLVFFGQCCNFYICILICYVLYCTAIVGASNYPVAANTLHRLGNIQLTCKFEVDCNENKHYVGSAVSVSAKVSEGDHISDCTNALPGSDEASSHLSHPVNMSGVVLSCEMKDSVQQNETHSDTCSSQNSSTDLLCNLQNISSTLYDSFCNSDSDCVSQSQVPQLTNTQKVEIFARELDMMKPPVSAHDSETSVCDSLLDMSSAVFW